MRFEGLSLQALAGIALAWHNLGNTPCSWTLELPSVYCAHNGEVTPLYPTSSPSAVVTALAFARHPRTHPPPPLRDAFAYHGRGRARVGAPPPPLVRASAPPSGLPLLPSLPCAPQFRAPHHPGPAARARAEADSDGGEGGRPRRYEHEVAHIRRTDAGADLTLPPFVRCLSLSIGHVPLCAWAVFSGGVGSWRVSFRRCSSRPTRW
jgi:hypothetical protein